jgi:hypothetical protein
MAKKEVTSTTNLELAKQNSLSAEGVVFSNSEERGSIIRIKPKELAESGTTGEIFIGRYEGTLPNNLNPESPDYKFRGSSDTLYILNSCGSIKKGMAGVQPGELVRVSYKGQNKMTKGPAKGKMAHLFQIDTAKSAQD